MSEQRGCGICGRVFASHTAFFAHQPCTAALRDDERAAHLARLRDEVVEAAMDAWEWLETEVRSADDRDRRAARRALDAARMREALACSALREAMRKTGGITESTNPITDSKP